MKLRGIVRAATAVAVTALLAGGLGAPAFAEEEDPELPGAVLNIGESGVWAASYPSKGCAGIDTGVAVAGTDGWLFSKPAGKYKDLYYILFYFTGTFEEPTEIYPIILTSGGVFSYDLPDGVEEPEAVAKALSEKLSTQEKADVKAQIGLQFPAPAGVTAKLVDSGGWVKTPAGWGLGLGVALSTPLLGEGSTFDLVRACAAPASPSTSPSPSGPTLPVTGTNVWFLSGAGLALVAVGAVLFMAYRRRQSVKFVA